VGANLVPFQLRPKPPPLWLGVLAAVAFIAAETLVLFPLRENSPVGARGVVYLCGVLVVAIVWGATLSVVTAVASSIAFNYFHVPPFWSFNFNARVDLQMVAIFIAVGLVTSRLADMARCRAVEASQRREEADLSAELAKLMLCTDDLRSALGPASQRLAEVLELRSALIELGAVPGDERCAALPLYDGATCLGTLLVPAGLPEQTTERLRQRVVPSLESLLRAAHDREAITNSLKASREESTMLMEEQAALHSVATMVAREASLTDVFDAVTAELCRTLGPVRTALMRYEPDRTATRIAGLAELHDSMPIPLDGDNIAGTVFRTSRPTRINSSEHAKDPAAATGRGPGLRSAVGVPIMTRGRLWGVFAVVSFTAEPIPPAAEARLADFTNLIATAIANTERRAQLAASRARIVTAADAARRQLDRELHDGALQRLVSLGLELGMIEASMPPELNMYKKQLVHAVQGLTGIFEYLQEVSREIHPAIMSKGGLGASIKSLARRSAIPVELNLNIRRQLPEQAEVAAYYVVSEALANAAKHARATVAHVNVETDDAVFRLSIQDDGIGGASLDKESGLIGLQDRVESLGGHMEVLSPAGYGTALLVKIPIDDG
jgi:signal transduction histidine kinase